MSQNCYDDPKAQFDAIGYTVIHQSELIQKVSDAKALFLTEFIPKMSREFPQTNRELIKRFSDHPMVGSLFLTNPFLSILQEFLNVPVKCGPTVSHYTSNDTTGNGYGLPFHQDYPSMGSSESSVIGWLNLVDLECGNARDSNHTFCAQEWCFAGMSNRKRLDS